MAILLIVAGHCGTTFSGDGFSSPSRGAEFLFDLVTGGTALFVFVSGFLFHHLLKDKFQYVPFLKKKAVSLLLPYAFVTATCSFVTIIILSDHGGNALLALGHLTYDLFHDLRFGAASNGLWYIPFIFALFMFSPFFVRAARMPAHATLTAGAVFFLVGLYINRSNATGLPFQQIAHFGPYFMIGMICSRWRTQFEFVISKQSTAILATTAAVGFAYLQMRFGHPGQMVGAPFEPIAFDYKYLQKFALCIAFCSILIRFDSQRAPALDLVASYSFGIFFLHGSVIIGLANANLHNAFLPANAYANFLVSTLIVMTYTIAVVHAVKALAGKRSRYLIGA